MQGVPLRRLIKGIIINSEFITIYSDMYSSKYKNSKKFQSCFFDAYFLLTSSLFVYYPHFFCYTSKQSILYINILYQRSRIKFYIFDTFRTILWCSKKIYIIHLLFSKTIIIYTCTWSVNTRFKSWFWSRKWKMWKIYSWYISLVI